MLRISGGRVLRPDHSIERANVLIDQDAGTIEAVGEDVGGADRELDAAGGLVIPGLVNAHCHVAMTLLRGNADDKPLDTWLQEDIWPVEAELTEADVRAGARLGIVEMIRSGTTAFGDMYFFLPGIADAVEATGIRARIGHGVVTVGKDDDEIRGEIAEAADVAAEFDGAADGRLSTAVMPHSLTTVSEDALTDLRTEAREKGVPLHLHANETKNEVDPIVDERGKRPLEYADDLDLLGANDFLAHCVHVDDAEIDLLAERGTAVAHCPASNMKLASGMAPIQRMLDRGVTVGIGTDGPASNNDLDMFDELRDAAMIGKLAADDASAMAADTAFHAATQGSAQTIGVDSGRIDTGANADIAVVDLEAPHLTPAHDLVSNLVYAARGADVRHTICDGQVLMADRELEVVDEAAVRAEAREHAAELLERAGAT